MGEIVLLCMRNELDNYKDEFMSFGNDCTDCIAPIIYLLMYATSAIKEKVMAVSSNGPLMMVNAQ